MKLLKSKAFYFAILLGEYFAENSSKSFSLFLVSVKIRLTKWEMWESDDIDSEVIKKSLRKD